MLKCRRFTHKQLTIKKKQAAILTDHRLPH